MAAEEQAEVVSESRKQDVSALNVFKFAGAFVAFMIGSGYATGQEIVQFFTAYGWWSLGALGIAFVLFTFVTVTVMDFGQRHKYDDINVESAGFRYFCGRYFGMFLEWFIPIFLFFVVVVMVSGSGATIAQLTGLPHQAGTIFMAVLVLLSNLLGLRKIVDIIGMLAPIAVIITLIVSIYTIFNNAEGLAAFSAHPEMALDFPAAIENRSMWWLAGLLYVAYNVTGSIPFYTATGQMGNSHREVRLAAVIGATVLVGAALLLNVAMLSVADQITHVEVPVLAMATAIHPVLAVIFSIAVLTAIFTTASPMMWIASNRVAQEGTKKHKIILLVLCVVATFGGFLPFGKLVGTIYPFTGYIGIAVILLIMFRAGVQLKNKAQGKPIETPANEK